MQRTFIKDTLEKTGQSVILKGWVDNKRDFGKLTFIDLRDSTGKIQLVGFQKMADLGIQDAIQVTGQVKKRSEKTVNPDLITGQIEVDVQEYQLLAKAAVPPFDITKDALDLELPTLLDHRSLTLRHPKVQAVFRVQAVIVDAFRRFLQDRGFLEFQSPTIVPEIAEGGSEVFQVDYFDKKAYLTQSPQLYKQIAMSAFERVFSVNKVFRAEPSVTTRHITEIVSLDAEMAFIEDLSDIINLEDACVKFILSEVGDKCANELKIYQATLPAVIEKTPVISLKEAQEKIFARTGRDVRNEKDLNPEDEKDICQIIKEETGSDLVFVYGYPTRKKPFYVYPNPENPEVNEGVDLLCRGIEWSSGGRRINDYDQLLRHIKEWGMDPNKITLFLEAFKYGVPPEGGFALGLERLTMQILGLGNIREATMFPRDMERVDLKLEGRP
ncbi:MAG: aspartate--tRNA(Asn) ligase [Candidatus Magasanikbacteria bacterium RIFOXYA2_FULL_44_8]|uniref:Aspartate--tRNA ligase n=1 Tax=Candidatus Magasanikbacteria bacterium RIFOXYA2_FULL_44_8 TaxID=1798696 RepID=A0A1F6NJ26_9BACT|nr:MAG: aspartate--tRNA(Asn) ligase [Candidatus Magasanikbacteria bacterium RIFOXYA2_FULL_44_8]